MAVVDYMKEGRIAIFTLNRPEAMNALNAQTRRELNERMADFADDPDLWVGIITGAGNKAFSAGHDIKELLSGPPEGETGERMATAESADQIWKPFIAAINGFALGGGLELALTCDIRIAAEHARLGQPEVSIGFMSDAGSSQRLHQIIPWGKAAEMLLMGQPIDAQEAYRIGLVNKVVPLDQLMPTAKQWAETICQAGPLGVRRTKEAMIRGYSMTLQEGLWLERELANSLRDTEDFHEGTTAFTEKRKPNFKGK